MSNTIFIALQCCECSIMQVKQRKRSSNKWKCVVCNQKQSLRKVFAQGYMAKDLRQFVQSFNISLKDKNSKTDWTDNSNVELKEEEEEEEDEEEMPNKKPKLNRYTDDSSGEREASDGFYKPILSSQAQVRDIEGKETKQSRAKVASKWRDYLTQKDEEPRTNQPTMTNVAFKCTDYKTQDDMIPRNCQATMGKATSKWSEYLTEDDQEQRSPRPPKRIGGDSKWETFLDREENDLQDLTVQDLQDRNHEWNNGVFETTTNDQEVEDDIHPDFI